MGLKISCVKKSDIDKGMTEDVNNRKKDVQNVTYKKRT